MALESLRPRAERRRRCGHRFLVLRASALGRPGFGGRQEQREKPVQLSGKRGERGEGAGWTGRPALGAEHAPLETRDRLAGDAAALGQPV
jgi:hypothetical protein